MTRGITIDVKAGLSSSVAVKGPCLCATTANITLAGEQTIDGVLTDESRVLVLAQTDSRQNGIYLTDTGDWSRQPDFSRNDDVVPGTMISVVDGDTLTGIWAAMFTGALAFDTTSILFITFSALAGYTHFLQDNAEDQSISGGAVVVVKDLGNLSGASITPDPGDRSMQKISNNGAGSILPGVKVGSYLLEVINTAGAGAITTTGWTLKGDSFDVTAASKFLCSCVVTADLKLMSITKVA